MSRTWAQWVEFPSEREPVRQEPITATRRDGTVCDLLASIGVGPAGDDEDFGVHWEPVT